MGLAAALTLFVVLLYGLTVVSGLRTNIDPLGDRLLSPLFVPLVVLALAALSRFTRRKP